MQCVKFNLNSKYGSIIDKGAISYLPCFLRGVNKILIVADEDVYAIYKEKLISKLEKITKLIFAFTVPKGENSKNKSNLDKLVLYMSEINILKTDCVIAFGGGTISDLTGFASAIYKRGIPYVNVPTTLLSMADASVGGKTAIDFMGRKNILGTIYQPKAVFCDTDFLTSLPQKELSSGMAEIIKTSVIGNKDAFSLAEEGALDFESGIYTALKIKSKLVKKDEYDKGARRLLNFGHTFGHAIESLSGFSMTHGEAIAYGMIVACEIAEFLKISFGIKERLKKAFDSNNIKYDYKIDRARAWDYILSDKKREGDKIALVLPKRIGKCVVKKVAIDKIREAFLGL